MSGLLDWLRKLDRDTGPQQANAIEELDQEPPATNGALPCQQKHWIEIQLHWKDDKTPVTIRCVLTKSGATKLDGPLANGKRRIKDLPDGGMYTVSFPDIDADEWAAA
jgi:hypothetical protein